MRRRDLSFRGLTMSLPCSLPPHALSRVLDSRSRRSRQMQWEFMLPLLALSLYPETPLTRHSIHPSAHSHLTHHSKLALLLHHAGHRHGGAGVGAHHRVVCAEEVHLTTGTASQSGGAAADAEKDGRRLGSRHDGVRNVAATRPWRARERERESGGKCKKRKGHVGGVREAEDVSTYT